MSVVGETLPHMTPQEILAFESRWSANGPEKRAAIRGLGVPETRYYVLLHRAATSPEGIRADPITARMVRERAQRQAEQRERRVA